MCASYDVLFRSAMSSTNSVDNVNRPLHGPKYSRTLAVSTDGENRSQIVIRSSSAVSAAAAASLRCAATASACVAAGALGSGGGLFSAATAAADFSALITTAE